MKSISTQQISDSGLRDNEPSVLHVQQKFETNFTEVLPPDLAKPSSLVFASSKKLFDEAAAKKVKGYILTDATWAEIKDQVIPDMAIWTIASIPHAMSLVLPLFDLKKDFINVGAHQTASIHPTAKVSPTASIGPYCVIEAHAEVGDDTYLAGHVFVGAYCTIGARCHIGVHVSIGSDGFGFYSDKKNVHHKIPQIGRVVIEDDCELGAFNSIDRATLTETRIKKGNKTDNYCHFAHNVIVGENGLMACAFRVAGSTHIGKNILTAGAVDVNGHIKIADNVILTARAGVTASIPEAGVYGGFPLETHKESIKTLMSIPQIKKIRKQVRQILKHLQLKEEE